MEKTFAGLLRHSRLASYDRTLPQVYTTPKKAKKVGNWGFKRGLPTVVRTRYVTVGDLDTAEHQTPWQSGESQVLFVKRWKENFPNSKAPAPRREQVQHNVAAMTPRQFKQFLKQASQQAPAFQQALKNKELVPEQVYDYLSCHFNKDLVNDQQQDGGIVGPTYSDHQVEWNYPVLGRILNVDTDGYAVGISGVVAKLPRRHSSGLRNSGDRRVREFYVVDAQLNQQGRPEVTVNLQAYPSSMNSILTSSYYPTKKMNEPALEDMFSGRRSSRFQDLRNDSDNIQPNPNHQELMTRISGLLDTSTNKKK
ncbi:uncharacterized protein BX664DRAFT_329012 [Halteromyces radiatus]|uniref:uncharacterized protein n=1 Tax=Halteromyces radiatus TaxID=101107 RepID=UPI00221E5933|nr:uncharacterized protein BX664DRAFT_329012 [Halteromyces radiatus]KAI8093136.1 hypothetical protein BX664DRAFT_329012 [Halteromyces radiatus]